MDQNLPKRTRFTDRSKSKLGLFLVEIFEITQEQEKFGGFGGNTRSNPWQPRALIPYDAEKTAWVARSSRIDGGKDELTQEREEHEEHEEERSGIHEHKQDTRTVSLTGRSNRSNRIPKGEIGKIHKKGSWKLFLQRPTEPFQ